MKIKQYLKNWVYFAVYYTGALYVLIAVMRLASRNHRGLILFYHRFHDVTSKHLLPSLDVDEFEKQIKHLKRMYDVITMDALADRIDNGSRFKKPYVAITIDDGFRDNFTLAYPVLKKYDIPALVYLTAGLVGTDSGLWLDDIQLALSCTRESKVSLPEISGERSFDISTDNGKSTVLRELYFALLPHNNDVRRQVITELSQRLGVTVEHLTLRERVMLHWDEVRQMAVNGIDFAAHTLTHPFLPAMPREKAEEEIKLSREMIQNKLGVEVKHFAIPNGKREDFTAELFEYCKGIGFRTVVTTVAGPVSSGDDLFSLNRVSPPPPMHIFACEVARYLLLPSRRQLTPEHCKEVSG